VAFETARAVQSATLILKRGPDWEQLPARLETSPGRTTATAVLPTGTTAYFFNLAASGATLSSELQTVSHPPSKR
jgi:hypothetical protein